MAKPKTKPPKVKPQPLSQRVAHDPALLKRALANPGLRSKLPDRFLSPAQRQQRALSARLNAPATEGSSLTNRDVARQANTATTVKYAGAEGELGRQLGDARQNLTNQGSYYEQYQKDLAAHQANVAGYQKGAVDAISQLAPGLAGIAPQGQGAQGDVDAKALAVRQALANSFAANAATTQAANNTYADTLTNVVAPGARLGALSRAQQGIDAVRSKQGDLAREKGAFNQSTRDQIISDEGKNVLARQIANVNQDKASAAIASTKATTAKTKATTQKTQAEIDFFNKHGYWPKTGPTTKPDTGKVNKYGYTDAQWRAMTVAQRQKIIKDFGAKPKAAKPQAPATKYANDFYKKYGVKPASTAAINTGKSSVSRAQTWIARILQTNPDLPLAQVGQLLSTGQPADKKAGSAAVPKMDPLWVRVAMDLRQYRGVTPATANRLHHAGYSVRLLGLPAAHSGPVGNIGTKVFGGAR